MSVTSEVVEAESEYIMFTELTQKDNLEAINNLFASDGWSLYLRMESEWFKAGVRDAANGMQPVLTWCKPYMTGYRTLGVVMVEVADVIGEPV